MAYIGRQNLGGAYRQLDDISSGFDGSDTTHTMQVNSANVTVGDVNQIILSLGGVIQKPGTDFTVSGSVLTFTTAPAANTSFFAVLLGSDNGGTTTPTDLSVTTAKIGADQITKAKLADSIDVFAGTSLSAADLGAGIHVKSADSGASVQAGYDELVIENSANSGLSILSGTNGFGGIMFGDSGDNDIGQIYYGHGSNSLVSVTNGATAQVISSAGEVTKPLQPAFSVNPSSTQSNLANNTQIAFGTENFDVGSNFASNTFTAPITGKYQLNLQLRLNDIDSAASYIFVQVQTSNRNYQSIFDPGEFNGDLTYFYMHISAVADMDASDTASVHFYQPDGTAQTDVETGGTNFSGCLLA